MAFEQILESIGGSGRYQASMLVITVTLHVFVGFQMFLPVIVAYQQKYQCFLYHTSSVPGNGSIIADECYVYRNESPSWRISCVEWSYDESLMRNTIVSQFDLVCDREYLISLSSSLFFIGCIIGCTVYGLVSDKFGRSTGVILSTMHLSAFSLAAAFAPNIWVFAALRLMSGIGTGGLSTSLFASGIEVIDVAHRAALVILINCGLPVAGLFLALFGYLIKDHFWIQIALSLSTLIGLFSFPLATYESPRWLLIKGKMDKADKVIRSIANRNKKKLPEDFDIQNFVDDGTFDAEDSDESVTLKRDDALNQVARNFIALFKGWYTGLTTIITWTYWFIISLGFFGSMYSLGTLGDNVFISMVIAYSMEMLSLIILIFIIERLDRIIVLSACAMFGGVVFLVIAVLIGSGLYSEVTKFILFISVMFFEVGFTSSWFYTCELFPTVIRGLCLGIASTMGRMGATMAPQVIHLNSSWKPSSMIVMGTLTIIGGTFSLFLPETKSKGLTETMTDGKRLMESGFGISIKIKNVFPGVPGAKHDFVMNRRSYGTNEKIERFK